MRSKIDPIEFQLWKLQSHDHAICSRGHVTLISKKSGRPYVNGISKKRSPLYQREKIPSKKRSPLY